MSLIAFSIYSYTISFLFLIFSRLMIPWNQNIWFIHFHLSQISFIKILWFVHEVTGNNGSENLLNEWGRRGPVKSTGIQRTVMKNTDPIGSVSILEGNSKTKNSPVTPSCENTKITTNCWTIINRKTLELTKKDTPHIQRQRRNHNEMVRWAQSQ